MSSCLNPLTWLRKSRRYRPKVEVYQGIDGAWRTRLRAANGKLILGPDPYDSKSNAVRAGDAAADQLDIDMDVLTEAPEPERNA